MSETIGYILCPEFALMSATCAVEPLRAANLLSEKSLYRMVFLSPDGGRVASSCGGGFDTVSFDRLDARMDRLFIVAGANPFLLNSGLYTGFLRKAASLGTALGGISGGAVVLAQAGLMKDRRFTVHWEHSQALQEDDPDHMIEKRLFVIDRDRATCAGGVAPLDMMHALIMARHGAELANGVSDWFIHTGVRLADAPQRFGEGRQGSLQPPVAHALRLMDDHIADPLTLDQIARLSGISGRQLQRRFLADMGTSVMQYYLGLRLAKGKQLLRQSRLPLSEIALATGFSSQSNFTRAFRQQFQKTPTQARAPRHPGKTARDPGAPIQQ